MVSSSTYLDNALPFAVKPRSQVSLRYTMQKLIVDRESAGWEGSLVSFDIVIDSSVETDTDNSLML